MIGIVCKLLGYPRDNYGLVKNHLRATNKGYTRFTSQI